MNPRTVALLIIAAIVGIGSLVGFLARFHHKMDLEQWTVAGRGFGVMLVWLLMAGEIYTIFTFLGASGWAYSKGAPTLYILGHGPLDYVVAFFILPLIWEAGRKHRLQTQADFFQVRYGSKYLSALVALVGVVSLIPYVQIQVTGLGLIVEISSFGGIHRTLAMIIGFALVAGFVFVSGVRGIAWVSVIKDILLLFAAIFLGIAIPHIYFGGVDRMFTALLLTKPSHLVMPGSTRDLGHAWYVTTVMLVSLGFYMWPQYFAASYTACDSATLRRNAVILPLYLITMPLMLFVGLAALLVMPGMGNGDLSLLTIVRKTFPPWLLGAVGGAGAVTAMVAAAIQLLSGATLFAKNLVRPILAPAMTDRQVAALAKITVLGLTSGAVVLAIYVSMSLASLWLLGLAGVAQLFPGVVLGLFSKRVTTAGVLAGLVSGIAVVLSLMLTGHDQTYHGLSPGFIALCINFSVTALVSRLTTVHVAGFDEIPIAIAADGSVGSVGAG